MKHTLKTITMDEYDTLKARSEVLDEAISIIELLDGAGLNPITSLQLEKCRKASAFLSKAKELK